MSPALSIRRVLSVSGSRAFMAAAMSVWMRFWIEISVMQEAPGPHRCTRARSCQRSGAGARREECRQRALQLLERRSELRWLRAEPHAQAVGIPEEPAGRDGEIEASRRELAEGVASALSRDHGPSGRPERRDSGIEFGAV